MESLSLLRSRSSYFTGKNAAEIARLMETRTFLRYKEGMKIGRVQVESPFRFCVDCQKRGNIMVKTGIFAFALVLGLLTFQTGQMVVAGELKLGQTVPEFSALDQQGKKWDSKDHIGKKILVIYFYPADMTGGCTKQACAFRDDLPKLKAANVEVVGVSGDTVKNHQLFVKAHNLNFTLLADTDGKIAKTFGVPTRKGGSIQRTIDNENFTLTRGVTASRWTFIIDLDGKLVHKNTAVNAAQDSKNVMQIVEKLKK